jgi:hypothetical protein
VASSRRRTVIRRFLRDLGLFLLPLAAGTLALEGLLSGLPTSYSQKRDLLERASPQVEVLVLGTSHAYHGLDPGALRRPAFNLANVSQSLRYDRLLLDTYVDRLPRLSLVLLAVSYHSLRFDLSAYGENWRMFFYERTYGFPAPFPAWDPRHWSWIALFGGPNAGLKLLWDEHRGQRHDVDRYDARGMALPRPRTPDISLESGRARVRMHEREVMQAWAQPGGEAELARAIDRLAARRVRAVVVTLPVCDTYFRQVDPALLAELHAGIRRVVSPRRVVYLDHFADPRFTHADFLDNDHLAPAGARHFGQVLDDELARRGLYAPLPPRVQNWK